MALFFLASSESPSIMMSQLINLGSIDDRICIKNLLSLSALSLKSLIGAWFDPTYSLAQATTYGSSRPFTNFLNEKEQSYHKEADTSFLSPFVRAAG